MRELRSFKPPYQHETFQHFLYEQRVKKIVVEIPPFSLLQDPVFAKVPRFSDRAALIGTWTGPGILHNQSVFLKGPIPSRAAWAQYAINQIKLVLDPEQYYLFHIHTEVVIFGTEYYILMKNILRDYDTHTSLWSAKPPQFTYGTVENTKDLPFIKCVQFRRDANAVCHFDQYIDDVGSDVSGDDGKFSSTLKVLTHYMAIILFRAWMGIPDSVHSNILACPDEKEDIVRLHSVDEMDVGKYGNAMVSRVSNVWLQRVRQFMSEQHWWCVQMLSQWNHKLCNFVVVNSD